MWKDITTYRQGDTVRRPTVLELRLGFMVIVLVWDHRYAPGMWSMKIRGIWPYPRGFGARAQYEDISSAKAKALRIAKELLEDALAAERQASNGQ